MTIPVRVTAQPLDELRCRLVLDRPVEKPGTRTYRTEEEAADSPVARAVLSIPAICEVTVSGSELTVLQAGSLEWSQLEPQVRYAVEAGIAELTSSSSASSLPSAAAAAAAPSEDDLYDFVLDIFDQQINPAVAQHGGKVELLDVQDGTVVVRMLGGCQGCGMANVTLRQGIEASLRRMVPGFQAVKDITDHAAGTNPYFASGSK